MTLSHVGVTLLPCGVTHQITICSLESQVGEVEWLLGHIGHCGLDPALLWSKLHVARWILITSLKEQTTALLATVKNPSSASYKHFSQRNLIVVYRVIRWPVDRMLTEKWLCIYLSYTSAVNAIHLGHLHLFIVDDYCKPETCQCIWHYSLVSCIVYWQSSQVLK